MAQNDFLDDEPYPGSGKKKRDTLPVGMGEVDNMQPEGFGGGLPYNEPAPDGLPYSPDPGPADGLPYEQGPVGDWGPQGSEAPFQPQVEPGPAEGLPYEQGPVGDFGPQGSEAPFQPQVEPGPAKVYDHNQGMAPPPEGAQFRQGDDKLWLDWIDKTFGTSPTRGGGFANPGDRDMGGIVDQFNTETGANAVYEGGPSRDRVNFGEGTRDVRTSGGDLWYDYGGGGAAQGGAPSFGGGQPPRPGVEGHWGRSRGVEAGGQQSEMDQARRAMLLKMMGQLGEPYDPSTDHNVKAQTGAYATSRNRGAEMSRAKLAERAAASGLNSGGQGSGSFDTQLGGIYDDASRDIAGQEAGVIGGELQARRQQLMQTLAMANAVGAQDDAQQLQLQLAQLDDEYRKMALSQQGSQFNAQLGQQGSQFQQNLQQQQGQWNDQYGLNLQQLIYGMDRDTMLQALLGGG